MKSKNLSEKILKSVKSKGFKYIELPSVIEANHIFQRSGENFRKFVFSFIDAFTLSLTSFNSIDAYTASWIAFSSAT